MKRLILFLSNPASWQHIITPVVMITGLIWYIVYDIVADVFGGDDATISRTTYRSGTGYLGVVFAVFALMTHLFFVRHESLPRPAVVREYLSIAGAAIAGIAVAWIFFRQHVNP